MVIVWYSIVVIVSVTMSGGITSTITGKLALDFFRFDFINRQKERRVAVAGVTGFGLRGNPLNVVRCGVFPRRQGIEESQQVSP